jgi:hypothetical protein
MSSLKMAAVAQGGEPLPWYTYPCIDFLRFRDFAGRSVLEFGGGQSTLWWARRAKEVVTFEGDPAWYETLRDRVPQNVNLQRVTLQTADACDSEVRSQLARLPNQKYDVVVVDGLHRFKMIDLAMEVVADDGFILVDNADAYAYWKRFLGTDMSRVDFFGYAPGVVLPHCTSIYFRPSCFVVSNNYPVQSPLKSHALNAELPAT